jgi:hypothetical protein
MDGPITLFPTDDTTSTDVTLQKGEPRDVPFVKTGTPPGGPPTDKEFGQAYFADRTLNLPVGLWEIYALSSYVPGGCGSSNHAARNPVSVVVTISS